MYEEQMQIYIMKYIHNIYYEIYTSTKEMIKHKRYKCVSGTITNDIIDIKDVSVQKIYIYTKDRH